MHKTGDIDILVGQITSRAQNREPYIVAVSGFGGSGKTTLAQALHDKLSDSAIVCIDSFSTHQWSRDSEWSNFDRQRFANEVLAPARNNSFPLSFSHIPWPGQEAGEPNVVQQVKFLIVEGCSIFHPSLLSYYDYKIWVDCDLNEATKRGMWRDRHVFKDEHDQLWLDVWMPNEQDFMDKYHPDTAADTLYIPESYTT